MQEFCCFIVFLCQCIHYFVFPEIAERGGGYSPPSHPPRSATVMFTGYFRISLYFSPLNCTVWVICLNTGSIESSGWVMQQRRVNSLAAFMQVSIAIAANLIASYASIGRGSLLASHSVVANSP